MGVLNVFNWEGVSVAPGSTIFTVAPTWTRLDNLGNLRVAEIAIRRGRQSEFEKTDTGECTVTFNDRDGDVDPTAVDWISRPFAFAVRDPVADTWHPRFRGAVDDHHYSLHPSALKGDAGEILAAYEKTYREIHSHIHDLAEAILGEKIQ